MIIPSHVDDLKAILCFGEPSCTGSRPTEGVGKSEVVERSACRDAAVALEGFESEGPETGAGVEARLWRRRKSRRLRNWRRGPLVGSILELAVEDQLCYQI